jgi:hypothetical protein
MSGDLLAKSPAATKFSRSFYYGCVEYPCLKELEGSKLLGFTQVMSTSRISLRWINLRRRLRK